MKATTKRHLTWAAAGCVATGVFLVGCDDHNGDSVGPQTPQNDKVTPPKPQATTDADAKVVELTEQLRDEQIAFEKARLAFADAKKQHDDQLAAKSTTAPDTTALATALVDFTTAIKDMRQRIAALEDGYKAINPAGMPNPVLRPFTMTPDGIPVPAPSPTAGPSSSPTPNDSVDKKAQDSRDEAMNHLTQGLAMAICAAEPELIPVIAAIMGSMNLFNSTEDRDQFLNAATSLASGQLLTPQQVSNLQNDVSKDFAKLPPEAIKLYKVIAQQPSAATLVDTIKNAAQDWVAHQSPELQSVVKVIRDCADGKLTPDAMTQQVINGLANGRFPSKGAKDDVLRVAESISGKDSALSKRAKNNPVPITGLA